MDELGDFLAGRHDKAHIRIFGLPQGSRHADVDRVEFGHNAEIRGGAELAGFHQSGNVGLRNILNIGIAGVDTLDLGFNQVDAGHRKTGLREFDGQGKSHIAEPYNTHARSLIRDLLRKLCSGTG